MSAKVHAAAFVDPAAELGEDVEIGPYCIVGPGAQIGPRTRLLSHVVIEGLVRLGADNIVHPHAILGGAPQVRNYKDVDTRLEIGDRNVIREGVTFNRGATIGSSLTRIGSDGFFMSGAHVAHDCVVGDRVTFANAATLGGHCHIGDDVFIGGLAAVHQFTRIGRRAFIGGVTPVTGDVIPFVRAAGNPSRLAGLNAVGLKRSGMEEGRIRALQKAYLYIFSGRGTFAERLTAARDVLALTPEVEEVLAFIEVDRKRELCHPPKRRA
jgi:UDP-N-acetylglucosamine acyltransferase